MAPAKQPNTMNTVTPQKLNNVFSGVMGQGKRQAVSGRVNIWAKGEFLAESRVFSNFMNQHHSYPKSYFPKKADLKGRNILSQWEQGGGCRLKAIGKLKGRDQLRVIIKIIRGENPPDKGEKKENQQEKYFYRKRTKSHDCKRKKERKPKGK